MGVTLGIIGFGEVGSIFAKGLRDQTGVQAICVWDTKFSDEAEGAAARGKAREAGAECMDGMAALCARVDIIFSAVTASNDMDVAREAARHVRPSTFFLDLNSASPGTKQRAAEVLEAAGAHYVEAGVMTSVPPYGIRVPMLLGGPSADTLATTLRAWGMDATPVSKDLGIASAIKMSRSIMIKGLEALVIESYTNARAYGVEDHVLPTLKETFPQIDWDQQGAYFFSRVAQHGKRRAEEMREAAHTVEETGFRPLMTASIADKHDWVAQAAKEGVFAGIGKDARWQEYADRLIARRRAEKL